MNDSAPQIKKQFLALLALLVSGISIEQASACPDRGTPALVDLNCDGQVALVTFGDSITAGVGDEQRIGGYPTRVRNSAGILVVNVGISGERTYQGRARAGTVFATYPFADYVVILEGVNDYWLKTSASNTRNNLYSIAATARSTGAITLLGSLTAVRRSYQKSWVSAVNTQILPMTNIDFFSLGEGIISSDLLHPNAAGYQRMALERVIPALQAFGEANRPSDRDGDGMYDFAELRDGYDPDDDDSDDDGLLDGDEVFNFGSSPLLTDTDGDGFDDFFEVRVLGSDPANPLPGPPHIREDVEFLPST